jgi:hypothetical protein
VVHHPLKDWHTTDSIALTSAETQLKTDLEAVVRSGIVNFPRRRRGLQATSEARGFSGGNVRPSQATWYMKQFPVHENSAHGERGS